MSFSERKAMGTIKVAELLPSVEVIGDDNLDER